MSHTAQLELLYDCVLKLSESTQGRPTDWRGQQFSIVFAKLGLTCVSFLRVVPVSIFFTPAKNHYVWDFSAAASLCRNLIEAYCVLRYLGTDLSDRDEEEFREALWEYHAAFERCRMLRAALPNSTRLPEAAARLAQCRTRIEQSTWFQKLSPKHQKCLLKGSDFKLLSNIELGKAAGISENYYRAQYAYCSAYAHSAPFSIDQMDAFRVGTPEAEGLFRMLANVATGYTAFAIRDFVRLFPDQTSALSPDVHRYIAEWEQILKWDGNPWFDKPDA